jgi:hypothetical protein
MLSGFTTCVVCERFEAKPTRIMSDLPMVQAIDDWEAEDEWQLTCYTDDIIYVLDKYEGNDEYEGAFLLFFHFYLTQQVGGMGKIFMEKRDYSLQLM